MVNPAGGLLRTLITLSGWIFLLILSHAVGARVFCRLGLSSLSCLDRSVFFIPLGLGTIAAGVFILGLAGMFRLLPMLVWILLVSLWASRDILRIIKNFPGHFRSAIETWKAFPFLSKGLLALAGIMALLGVSLALVPPWEFDSLMYHLEAPRQFLKAGRIVPLPLISQANGPMLIQMAYALGVAAGIDSLGKLIHLSGAALLILAAYSFGNRYLGGRKGWIPAAMLLGAPMVLVLGTFAYIDLVWALYSFLGLYGLLIWMEERAQAWLVLSAVLSGFALSSKYNALGYTGILFLFVIWNARQRGRRELLRSVLLFGGIVFAIGAPWYIKNWVWTGNPFYPLFFGGPEWPPERVRISATYLAGFGTGRSILDYLLLPLNIFIKQERFATLLGPLEIPSPLFLFAPAYLFIKNKGHALNLLALYSGLGFVYWALGSQQTRFLLPLFPALAVLSACSMDAFVHSLRTKRLRRTLLPGILGGMAIYGLIPLLFMYVPVRPMGVIVGAESRRQFVNRNTPMLWAELDEILPMQDVDDKILMLWDGQAYYCGDRCIPDTDNAFWTYLVHSSGSEEMLLDELREMNVTYLMINSVNASFVLEHDPEGYQLAAQRFSQEQFLPNYGQEVYKNDKGVIIFKIESTRCR
jgi:4-amino-4-deoxy-L-arabinose transferase-like glycosyltransferase